MLFVFRLYAFPFCSFFIFFFFWFLKAIVQSVVNGTLKLTQKSESSLNKKCNRTVSELERRVCKHFPPFIISVFLKSRWNTVRHSGQAPWRLRRFKSRHYYSLCYLICLHLILRWGLLYLLFLYSLEFSFLSFLVTSLGITESFCIWLASPLVLSSGSKTWPHPFPGSQNILHIFTF